MLSARRLALLALAALILAATILVVHHVMREKAAGPGVILELKLYRIDVEKREVVDVTSILDSPDVLMYLVIEAVAPPSPEWKEDLVTVAELTVRPKRVMLVRSDELLKISRGWVSVYRSRGSDPEGAYSGLLVSLVVYNSTSGEVLFEAYDSVSYKPAEVARGRSLRLSAVLVMGSPRFAELNVTYT